MAQGAVAPALANGATLTPNELRILREYEKIIAFKDAVLSGTHPRVKIPAHLVGKQVNSGHNVSSPSAAILRANAATLPAHSTPGSNREPSPSLHNHSPNNQRSTGGTHVAVTGNAEINPVLLEKSEDLIKAEIQLKRQRLERDLREQIEQQRIANKALLQTSESLPNFDLSEVLSKALAIVHPETVEPSVGARSSAASDSFDENTFYSSQHDTPEPPSSSQGQKERADMQDHRALSIDEHPAESSTQNQVRDREVVMTDTSLPKNNNLALQSQKQPQNSLLYQKTSLDSRPDSLEGSNSDSSNSGVAPTGTISANDSTRDAPRRDFSNVVPPPVVRAHNLSPFAPQPARVSPLATSRNPPVLRDPISIDEPQSATVTALRTQPSGLSRVSSSASSPKGGKGPEKKKEKKKKKRKGKEIVDSPDSPYIKTEPRSQSPPYAAPLPRPQKRQRTGGQYEAGLSYDEPRYAPENTNPGRAPQPYSELREVRAPRGYERVEEHYEAQIRRPEPVYQRLDRDEGSYPRVSVGQYAHGPESPVVLDHAYAPSELRQVRAASHAIVDRRIEEPQYYREPLPRTSVRPGTDRERSRSPRRSPVMMAPPRQPVRIIIDEYGRKYYDPGPSPIRQSVAPPARIREPEVIYERAPPLRAVSTRPVTETYDEEGRLYARGSPAPGTPRRVLTQPEYVTPEFRQYRQREYSVRPSSMLPPGEGYVEVRGPERPRQMVQYEEVPREYVQRAPSVRPEAIRYEVPREYAPRLQSVRPEQPPREYASSVHPEAHREMVMPAQRAYSVRPGEMVAHREHVPVADDGYYEQVPSRRPAAEVAFIERPRARESSVVVYADGVRGEMYR